MTKDDIWVCERIKFPRLWKYCSQRLFFRLETGERRAVHGGWEMGESRSGDEGSHTLVGKRLPVESGGAQAKSSAYLAGDSGVR